MIGTTVYELTSFEILVGGAFMFVAGVVTTLVVIGYAIWRICNKVESKKNSHDNSEQDYKVE